jgi:hypothetical protein
MERARWRSASKPRRPRQPNLLTRQTHYARPQLREEAAEPPARQGRRSLRLTLLLMVLIPVLAVAGAYYYALSQSYQSTDDAFIDDHVSNVAPKVAGRVDRVLVDDNQSVKKGIWLSSWTTGYRHGALKRFSTSPRRSPNTPYVRRLPERGTEIISTGVCRRSTDSARILTKLSTVAPGLELFVLIRNISNSSFKPSKT